MIDRLRTTALLARRSLLAGAATLTLAALAPPSQAVADDSTLTIGIEADLARLDPHISTTWNTFKALLHLYEGFVAEDLLATGVETPPIVPALAESWTISEDKKTYTFTLREGVTFHDGEPWNAEAAKFNLDRMTDPDFEFHQPGAVGMLQWVW
ncbi:MAG: ABC transporter substrate-binding protein, partial [Pseudomonadota bacterium]